MKVILASKSPRRKQLLGCILDDFTIKVASVEETATATTPSLLAQKLALCKASAVPYGKDEIVIGCDTIVVKDGKVFGKPISKQDAIDTLMGFSDTVHSVYTGVAILGEGISHVFTEQTTVCFKKLTLQQVVDYVDSGSPMDKAGSYGIQDSGFVKQIVGSYDNVVGFPTTAVKKVLDKYVKTKDYQEKNYG